MNLKEVIKRSELKTKFEESKNKIKLGLFGIGILTTLYFGSQFYKNIGIKDDLLNSPCITKTTCSVEKAIALINEQTITSSWAPNTFLYTNVGWPDNKANFQEGVVYSLARFSQELSDSLGRNRGTSENDPNLGIAQGALRINPQLHALNLFDGRFPLLSSLAETHYKKAASSLKLFVDDAEKNESKFPKRADNLIGYLERVRNDFGNLSSRLIRASENSNSVILDTEADDILFNTMGQVYATAVILSGIEKDFKSILDEKKLLGEKGIYDKTMKNFEEMLGFNPLIVENGNTDGIFASHLTTYNGYLLNARTQINEITDILRK